MKLPPFTNGLRAVPYYDARGTAWRLDAKIPQGMVGVNVPPGGDWDRAIALLSERAGRSISLKDVQGLIGDAA